MPRITPINLTQADAATTATLKAIENKLGILPNMFTTFAHAPAALNGFLQLSESLSRGRLSGRQREIIALSVAQANTCQYCLSAHNAIGKGLGMTENDIQSARQGKANDALDNAIAHLAQAITQQRGNISDKTFESAKLAGLDDQLIIEVVANVCMNLLTNYLNHIADTEVDFPAVTLQEAV